MLERQRLHISPFNPDLLSILIPAATVPTATNISFHSLQTFPDRHYGYVDLPITEADKIKKKFHGSILRGSTMRVEAARPEKTRNTSEEDVVEPERGSNLKAKKKGKRKASKVNGVIPGFELPEGRKVQRGWTEPDNNAGGGKASKTALEKSRKKSSKARSAFSEGPECLFKTKLPANAPGLEKSSAVEGKARKRKRGESGRDVVVHEFSNTTKHATFLKESQGDLGKKSASEYIDGKGWVDEDGNLVESVPPTRRTRSASGKSKIPQPSDESANMASFLEGKTEESTSLQLKNPGETVKKEPDHEVSSSSEASSSSEEESESNGSSTQSSGSSQNQNSEESGIQSPMDDIITSQTQIKSGSNSSPAPEVHPLEALFKRPKTAASNTPKKPTLELSTSFTFFGESSHGESENPVFLMPQTPFTQQDFRARRQRSAAPTPDTAAPGKTFGDVWARADRRGESDDNDDDDDNNDDYVTHKEARKGLGIDTGSPQEQEKSGSPSPNKRSKTQNSESTGEAQVEETEFQKWFYKHQGENNRAWKQRKREAVKEKRREDNKKRLHNHHTRRWA